MESSTKGITWEKWQYVYANKIMGHDKYIEVDDVSFDMFGQNCISYRFKNAQGLVFANWTWGDPMVTISPQYSKECKYNISSKPDLPSIAAAVKESWALFIQN